MVVEGCCFDPVVFGGLSVRLERDVAETVIVLSDEGELVGGGQATG
jgi:hypothetical protein